MGNRSNRSSRAMISRVVLTAGLVSVAVLAMAARSPSSQQPVKAAPKPTTTVQPPATAPAAAAPAMTIPAGTQTGAVSTAKADSTAAAMPMAAPAPTPAPVQAKTASGAWPVDAAGRTLVNGTPVVGRVFSQKKVDGLVKYEYSKVYVGEPAHPAAAIVSARHNVAPMRSTRRFRGIMVEATLWSMDTKRSARELRTYRPSTPASKLGAH